MAHPNVVLASALTATMLLFQPWEPASADIVTSCGRPLETTGGWAAQSPEQAGLDRAVLCELDAKLNGSPHMNVHGVVIARGGKLVFETYRAGDDMMLSTPMGVVAHDAGTLHDVRSVSKNVVSLLIGMALDRGLIASLDEPVLRLLPEYAALGTPEKDRIQLRHLLTMTSGLRWNEYMPYEAPNNTLRLMNETDDLRLRPRARGRAQARHLVGVQQRQVIYLDFGLSGNCQSCQRHWHQWLYCIAFINWANPAW